VKKLRERLTDLLDDPLGLLHAYIHRQGLDVSCPCNNQSRKPGSCGELDSNVEPAICKIKTFALSKQTINLKLTAYLGLKLFIPLR
jgi:hypothetical protein